MDVLDEHFYRSPAEMEHDSGHFDSYSRSGPKIFVGEWASLLGSYVPDQNSATLNPTSSMEMALGDAAWLTGLERNSDLVVMEAYAPLLVNVNPHAWQWGINLIGFDAARSFGSPSYYVQSIFAANTGDVTLPLTLQPPKYPSTFFAAASRDTRTGDILLKVVNTGSTVEGLQIQLMGARDVAKTAVATVLSGELADRNSVENPLQISPRTTTVSGIGSAFVYEFPAYSVTVLRLKARK